MTGISLIVGLYKSDGRAAEGQDKLTMQISRWLERYVTAESFLPDAARRCFTYPDGFPLEVTTLQRLPRRCVTSGDLAGGPSIT
jgi:hypothetical protein